METLLFFIVTFLESFLFAILPWVITYIIFSLLGKGKEFIKNYLITMVTVVLISAAIGMILISKSSMDLLSEEFGALWDHSFSQREYIFRILPIFECIPLIFVLLFCKTKPDTP